MPAFKTTYGVDYLASNPRGSNGDTYAVSGVIRGDDDKSYAVMQGTTGTSAQCCYVFDLTDGSVAHTITPATVTTTVGTYTYTNSANGGAVGDGRHLWAIARDVGANRYGVAFWYIDSDGNLAVNGTGLYRSSSAGGIDDGDVFCAGLKGTNLVCIINDGGFIRSLCVTGPGITTVENGTYGSGLYPWNNRLKAIGNASVIQVNISNTNMHRPVEGALFWADSELYGFFSKGDVDYYINNTPTFHAPLSLEAANFPDGFIAKFATSIDLNNGFPSCSVTAYSVDNDNWQDFPFDDGALRVDGVTEDFEDDYQRQPIAIPVGTKALVTFLKTYDDTGAGEDLGPTGTRFRVVGYYGNADGWLRKVDLENVGYDVVDDAGVGPSSRYSGALYPRTAGVLWHEDDPNLYVWEQRSAAPPPLADDYTLSIFGTLVIKKAGVILNVN